MDIRGVKIDREAAGEPKRVCSFEPASVVDVMRTGKLRTARLPAIAMNTGKNDHPFA
jgi:hypothetical protein